MIYNYQDFRQTIINLSLPRVFEEEEIVGLYKLYIKNPPSRLNTEEYQNFRETHNRLYNAIKQYGEEYAIRFFEIYRLYGVDMALVLFPVFLLNKIETNLSTIYSKLSTSLRHKMNINRHYNNVVRMGVEVLGALAEKVKDLPMLSIYHASFPYSILLLLMEGGQALISDTNQYRLNNKIRRALAQLFLLLKFKATKTSIKALFKMLDIDIEIEEVVVDLNIHQTPNFETSIFTNLFTSTSDPRRIEFFYRPYNPKKDTNSITLNPTQAQQIINNIINTLIQTGLLTTETLKTEAGMNILSSTLIRTLQTKVIKTNIMLITFIQEKLHSEDLNAIMKIIEKFAPYYVYSQVVFVYLDYSTDTIESEDAEGEEEEKSITASYPINFDNIITPPTPSNHLLISNTIPTILFKKEIPRLMSRKKISNPMKRLNEYYKNIYWPEVELYQ